MNEFEFQANHAENLLFTFLGGVCAIIVGIAIFSTPSLESKTDRTPPSEPGTSSFIESMGDLPILD